MKHPIIMLIILVGLTSPLEAKKSNLEPVDIPIERFVLENGLTVVLSQDKKAPVVAVNVTYKVGSKDEPEGRQGFAHLFEHLMFQGSENFDDEYFLATQALGATDLNGTTWFDRTNYFQTVPKNALDSILWLESDRMGHFVNSITQEKLDEQRNVVLNEKKTGENTPYNGVFLKTVAQAIYPSNHPYSWFPIGSEEDLNRATLEDVKNWFRSYYGPNNAYITIVGDIEIEETLEKVKKYFGSIKASDTPFQYKSWTAKRTQSRRDIAYDQVPLARVYKIWNVPGVTSKDIEALDFLTKVLSSGKSSMLYKSLVYDLQVASDVSAQLMPLELGSIFIVSATAKKDVPLQKVEKHVDEVLAQLIKKGVPKKTLEMIKMDDYVQYVQGLERVGGFSGKAALLANYEVFLGDANQYKESFKRFAAMDSDQIQDVAKKWLTSGDYTLEIHPEKKLTHTQDQVDRSQFPLPTQSVESAFPNVQQATLDNNINLFHIQRDETPHIHLQIHFDQGSQEDPKGKRGLNNLMMNLLDEGTKKHSVFELEEKLSLLGSSISTSAGKKRNTLSVYSLEQNIKPTLDLVKSVLLEPSFDQKEFSRLQKKFIEQIQKNQSNPKVTAKNIFIQKVFQNDHSYAHPSIGYETDLASIQRKDVIHAYQNMINKSNVEVFSIGSIEKETLVNQLNRIFRSWKPEPKDHPSIESVKNQKTRIYVVDRPRAPQTMIYTGLLVPRDSMTDNLVSSMVFEILGNNFTSRINLNLREDKAWTYGMYSSVSNYLDHAVYHIAGAVQTDQTAAAMNEIQTEIQNLLTSKPATQQELDKHRNRILLSMTGTWETNASVLAHLISQQQNQYPIDFYRQYPSLASAINLDQVNQKAKDLLTPDHFTWVLVGDRKEIEKEIRNLQWTDITFVNEEGKPVL